MSGAGADFIPLSSNSDKSGKKRKHKDNNKDQHEHRSGSNKDGRHHEHRSGSNKSSERDRDPKSSQVKNESRCPKLRARICKYLEENRHRVS
jgi:hypothetical protein